MKYRKMRSGGLLAVLLDAGSAQASQAMLVDRELPGQEFIHGQSVAAAGFFKGEKAAAHSGNNLGFAADNPPFGAGRWKIGNR